MSGSAGLRLDVGVQVARASFKDRSLIEELEQADSSGKRAKHGSR